MPGWSNKGEDFEQKARGRQATLIAEFWDFLKYNKKWWLLPIVLVLLLLAALVLIGGAGVAPFLYTVF